MPDEISPSDQPAKEQEGAFATTEEPTHPVVRKEREQFRALILGNPNYFGNVTDSTFPPIVSILSDTTFEELKCVGFNPHLNQLEAVVWIKQQAGYGGDICSPGTPEYIRFYVDWNNTGNFVDQGMTSFTVYDIPGDKPLEYAVTLQISPMEDFCFVENLPTVQAILSWNNPPPPNTPAFPPVWGNVLTGRIQIEPLEVIIFSKLLEEAQVKLPDEFASVLNLSQPITTAKPKALSVTERQAVYKDTNVPGHRFAFPEVQQLITNAGLTASLMAPGFKGFLTELQVNLAELIEELLETDGDTTFEELTCIGLNPNQDLLEGILTVKLPNGYSGKLCQAGSQEYVAFWVDYGDGTGFNYVGTTSVNVHDVSSIPPGGLQYAVLLPVDFSGHRQPCQDGPRTAQVRAILSWEVPPPPSNPNFTPTWGNQLNTLILVTPGPTVAVSTSFIETVGDMAVCNIDQTTGLASGSGVIAGFTANQSPFGGSITITGFITNAPNVLAGAAPFKYRVSVRQLDTSGNPVGPLQPLNNNFTITITQQVGGGLPTQFNLTQSIDPADGFYTYREQIYPNAWQLVAGRVLAEWQTAAPLTGLWEIQLEAKAADGTPLLLGDILCTDGSHRNTIKVLLDEVAPTAQIAITGFTPGSAVVHPVTDCSAGPTNTATDCGKFQVGDVIFGTYSTLDEHFNQLTLSVLPSAKAVNPVNPSVRAFPSVPTTGESGTWCLDTSGMEPCGYVIQLVTSDRTIVNSGSIGFTNSASVGFCLEEATPSTP